jgi:hypothetical protein
VAKITHHIDRVALHAMLSSPSGGVAKDLFRRGKKVETRAKLNLQRNPRRVNTGYLRSSINTQLISLGGKVSVRVGTNVEYAVFVHDGTGIYGPKGARIYPKTAKVLAWRTKSGRKMYATSVAGMKPNPFLADAVIAAKD